MCLYSQTTGVGWGQAIRIQWEKKEIYIILLMTKIFLSKIMSGIYNYLEVHRCGKTEECSCLSLRDFFHNGYKL